MHLLRTFVMAVALSGVVSNAWAECPRADSAAITLANEGDQARATNLDEAIDKYVEASRLAPSNVLILWKLATAYQKKEAWADVTSTLVFATKLAPDHANYFFLMGYAQSKQTLWADAKASLEQAAKLDPNYADPHFDLAGALLHLGDDQGALAQYTQAIRLKPDDLSFYAPLADLYVRLGYLDHAEQTAKEGLTWGSGAATFALHSLLGLVRERKGDGNGAIAAFEAAKLACGACSERGQQIAYFNVGAAYASAKPPRKAAAISNLLSFTKLICRGAAASRYADECMQAQELMRRMGP
jgi:tetratricopeptide (TPR) repeat protein